MSASDVVIRGEGHHRPKLKCRVLGAYFEKLGSKSFAVYSITVTDVNNNTWFVKRRYRNFERLDRHLKDVPNYTLHLPPKRIFRRVQKMHSFISVAFSLTNIFKIS